MLTLHRPWAKKRTYWKSDFLFVSAPIIIWGRNRYDMLLGTWNWWLSRRERMPHYNHFICGGIQNDNCHRGDQEIHRICGNDDNIIPYILTVAVVCYKIVGVILSQISWSTLSDATADENILTALVSKSPFTSQQ